MRFQGASSRGRETTARVRDAVPSTSRWWASWKRSSGSPAKSLSTMTRVRGAVPVRRSASSSQGRVPWAHVLG
ncbi:MAG: hypothetical protein ACFNME_08680, partial [Actinomyces dentalis]